MDFPAARLPSPVRRFPVRRCAMVLPAMGPDCHLVRTAILFLPWVDSLGDFHHSPSASLASFADRVSGGNRVPPLWPEQTPRVPPFTRPTQGRLRLHTALRAERLDAPHCRFKSASYMNRNYRNGSTSMHNNRSPRKQGRGNHAIGNRPESASV